MKIILSLIPILFISVVSTRELSSNTDIRQFIRKHQSKPWLKEASKWLSHYDDLLPFGRNKRPEVKLAFPDETDIDIPIRIQRKKHKEELDIDQEISEITSHLDDFVKDARKQMNTETANKRLKELIVAKTQLSDLRRRNTDKNPKHKALRGLEMGDWEYRNNPTTKKKAQEFREKLKKI